MRLGNKGSTRNRMKEESRGFGDSLGMCHKGGRELKGRWDLGLGDGGSDGQFKAWNWC